MELIKEKESYIEKILCERDRLSVEEDIIVPDIKPDILKVLQVDARAYITDRGLLSGGMYAKGKLYVNILYIPDGDEEEIGCIKAIFDFRSKIDIPTVSQDMKLMVCCDVTRADFTAINSRKLSIRATILVNYDVFDEKNIEIPCFGDETDFECIHESVNTERISVVEECEFSVRDSIEVPSGKKSISEILKTDVKVCDKEIKVLQSKLILKGNFSLCVLYLTDDKKTDYFDAEIPFTEVFDVNDLNENDSYTLNLSAGEINLELSQDNDGDLRVLNAEGIIKASLQAYRCSEMKLIGDCYCPGKKTKITANEITISKFIANKSTQNTIKEIITPDEKLPKIVRIYNTITEPEITKSYTTDAGIVTEGKIKIYFLYITDSAKCPIYSFKKEIPFNYNYECDGATQGLQCRTVVEVSGENYTLNPAGDIEFKCVLKQEITVTENKRISIIEEIETGDREQCSDIIIYFVKKDDTLWKIAKNYSVKVDDLIQLNQLESDNIKAGQKIIIPCR